METKKCAKCQKVKPLSEFGKNKGYRGGYDTYCKECRGAYDRTYRKEACPECGGLMCIGALCCISCKRREAHKHKEGREKRGREGRAETSKMKEAFWELFNPEPICSRCGVTINRKAKNLCQKCYYKDQPQEARQRKSETVKELWAEGRYDGMAQTLSETFQRKYKAKHEAKSVIRYIKDNLAAIWLSSSPERECRFCGHSKKFHELGKKDDLCKECRLKLKRERKRLFAKEMKRCSRCLRIKSLSGFHRDKDNWGSWCKACVSEDARRRKGQEKRERVNTPTPSGTKTCSKCGEAKPYSEFYKDSGTPNGYRYQCKDCVKAYDATCKEQHSQNYQRWKAERNKCPDCGVPISPWAHDDQRCPKCAGKEHSRQVETQAEDHTHILKYPPKKTHTDIELELAKALDSLGLTHIHHYSPNDCSYIFDEYLPNRNVLIEADGERYHHSDWAKELGVPQKDRKKDQWVAKNGYRLIRLRGRDIREFGAKACLLPRLSEQLDL